MNTIEHYGVKGMRWGVRKARNTASAKAKKFKQSFLNSKAGKKIAEIDSKTLKLGDAEVRKQTAKAAGVFVFTVAALSAIDGMASYNP